MDPAIEQLESGGLPPIRPSGPADRVAVVVVNLAVLATFIAAVVLARSCLPPSDRLDWIASLLPTIGWVIVLVVSVVIIVADRIWVGRRGGVLTGRPHRGKLLLRLIEWFATRRSGPHRKFRQARLMHEEYMLKHRIATDALTEAQRREAAAAPELDVVEQLYNEALDHARAAGHERNLAVGHQQLGLLHLIRGDAERARAQYTHSFEALEHVPFPDAHVLDLQSTNHFFLALLAFESGDFGEANRQLDAAANINNLLGDERAKADDAALRARIRAVQP